MNSIHLFQTTPRILMGPGCLDQIVGEIRRLDCDRVMIITDPGIVKAGIAGHLENILGAAQIAFSRFDQVTPDPNLYVAQQAIDALREAKAQVVIGIGGGSAIDIAKTSALLVDNNGGLNDYFGIDLVPKPGRKTIIVPTTAGTGSEVTPIVILSDEAEKLKKGVVSPYLIPSIAILDPVLTVNLPPQITAATGMDALIHAVEAYTSKNAFPMSDLLACRAIELISANIRTAYANGQNLEARACMLEGSLLAGMAFANAGVTAVHAFAYPIGAEFHIPHGVANSLMLASVMEFNMIGNLKRFARMANLLGECTDGLSEREMAIMTIKSLRTLAADLQIPKHLSHFGIKETDIPMLAAGVMKVTRLLSNNPRYMTQKDAEDIYLSVL
jgi:alcohol dehydrogenase class IV